MILEGSISGAVKAWITVSEPNLCPPTEGMTPHVDVEFSFDYKGKWSDLVTGYTLAANPEKFLNLVLTGAPAGTTLAFNSIGPNLDGTWTIACQINVPFNHPSLPYTATNQVRVNLGGIPHRTIGPTTGTTAIERDNSFFPGDDSDVTGPVAIPADPCIGSEGYTFTGCQFGQFARFNGGINDSTAMVQVEMIASPVTISCNFCCLNGSGSCTATASPIAGSGTCPE